MSTENDSKEEIIKNAYIDIINNILATMQQFIEKAYADGYKKGIEDAKFEIDKELTQEEVTKRLALTKAEYESEINENVKSNPTDTQNVGTTIQYNERILSQNEIDNLIATLTGCKEVSIKSEIQKLDSIPPNDFIKNVNEKVKTQKFEMLSDEEIKQLLEGLE